MILNRYWYEKGVVYDLVRPYHVHKTRAYKSTCNAINEGTRDPESLVWEVDESLPRFFIHFGSIHDRKLPGSMAVYHPNFCYGTELTDYTKGMLDHAILEITRSESYRSSIVWTRFRVTGEVQSISLPIKEGYIWSNHGNYWRWSDKKPQWVEAVNRRAGSRNAHVGSYVGDSCCLDLPFFNDIYLPDWNGAKDSLYAVIN